MIMKQNRKDGREKGVAAGATIYLQPLTENNITNKLRKFNAILSQKRIKLRIEYTSKYSLYISLVQSAFDRKFMHRSYEHVSLVYILIASLGKVTRTSMLAKRSRKSVRFRKMELQEFRWTRENEQTKERVNDADYGRQYCVSQHC